MQWLQGSQIIGIRKCQQLRTASLLAVGMSNLPDELGPGHVHRGIDGAGLWARVVFQDFHHEGCVIRDDHAGLQHAQKTDLSLGLAEGSGRVDCHIGVEAFANGGDGKWSLANPDFIA